MMINDGLESIGGDSGIIGYPLARGVAWYRERLSAGLTGRLSAKRVHKIKHPRQRLNWQGWQVGNGKGVTIASRLPLVQSQTIAGCSFAGMAKGKNRVILR